MSFRFSCSVVVAIGYVLTLQFLTEAQRSGVIPSTGTSVRSFSTVFTATGVSRSNSTLLASNITSISSNSSLPFPNITSLSSNVPSSSSGIPSNKSSSNTRNGFSTTVSGSSLGSNSSATSLSSSVPSSSSRSSSSSIGSSRISSSTGNGLNVTVPKSSLGSSSSATSLSSSVPSSSSRSSSSSIVPSKGSSSAGNGFSTTTVLKSSTESSSSATTLPIIFLNWKTVTPTSTAGVTKATHDSHGFPIFPPKGRFCWFCPPGGSGFLISGVTGPGRIKPPSDDTRPPGFSSGMPTITLDSAGDPTYDEKSLTSTGVSKTGSSQTVSTTGSVTSSVTSSTTGTFSFPPLGTADADPMLYEESLHAISTLLPFAVSIERAISNLEASVTLTTTLPPPITTTSQRHITTTSQPPITTTSQPRITTTTPPLITTTSPPPITTTTTPPPVSTTASVKPVPTCFPAHDQPVQDLSSIVGDWPDLFTDYCMGTSLAGTRAGVGTGTGSPSKNYVMWDITFASNAPPECLNMGSSSFDSQNMAYCSDPMTAIMQACPFNGGSLESSCGTTVLQTCPVGKICALGSPGG